MVMPESKTFSFGISDYPNINKVELFFRLNFFCASVCFQNWVSPMRIKKRIKNYIEITAENYIFILKIIDIVKNFIKVSQSFDLM